MGLTKQNNGKMRESGIELLRIILMLQVVFLHVCSYGDFADHSREVGGIRTLAYWLMMLSSRTPVYVYIVILGYFSVNSRSNQTFSDVIPKIKKTYLPMIFYSLIIPPVMWCTGLYQFSIPDLIKAFLPVLSRIWWFMTLYLVVIVLSPFLNKCLNNITKKEFSILLGILFFIFSIWNMLGNLSPVNEVVGVSQIISTQEGKGLYGYIFMYILGAYIRLHIKKYDKAKWRFLVAFFALTLINTALVYIVPNYIKVALYNDNPISVIQGACLLLFFRDLKFKSRIINQIAALNLGVYMIHEHYMVRDFIWNNLFSFMHNDSFYENFPIYIFEALGVCVVIFAGCALIEQLRRGLFALPSLVSKKKAQKQ